MDSPAISPLTIAPPPHYRRNGRRTHFHQRLQFTLTQWPNFVFRVCIDIFNTTAPNRTHRINDFPSHSFTALSSDLISVSFRLGTLRHCLNCLYRRLICLKILDCFSTCIWARSHKLPTLSSWLHFCILDFLSKQRKIVKVCGKLPEKSLVFRELLFQKHVSVHMSFEPRVSKLKKTTWSKWTKIKLIRLFLTRNSINTQERKNWSKLSHFRHCW